MSRFLVYGKNSASNQNLVVFAYTPLMRISQNSPYPPPLQKKLHNPFFSFLSGITAVPREIENNACAKFWGANKVHYRRCCKWLMAELSHAQRSTMGKKFFLSTHPRNVGSHGPPAPQGKQYKMTFFTLCGACNLCST